MMKRIFLAITLIATATFVVAQTKEMPDDFLGKDFHIDRRNHVRELLPRNSVAVFFANPVRNRSNDVDFVYHQDPNFYYLTGYTEPHSVLLIFKDMQTAPDGSKYNEIIFVQGRNAQDEMWTGRRLGVSGVQSVSGIQQAFEGSAFAKYDLNFSSFDQILFYDFNDDVRDDVQDPNDLFDLIESFKKKINYPDPNKLGVQGEPRKNRINNVMLNQIMRTLRGVKTDEELALLRRAISISCVGQAEVMKAMKPGMSEKEIQGIHEFVFRKYQAEDQGYPSIVGAGDNGCILHYIENYKPEITSKELVLMDVGAEYHGYTADITRTIPVSGKFSKEEKQVYDVVLKAQEAGIAICKAGTTFEQLNIVTRRVIDQGLAELKIISNPSQPNNFYPHGCCHHIGLDVHDLGDQNGGLQENMVVTIEPGIYIPVDSPTDKKWWNIGIRIEDDFLITKDGCENLSATAPRTTDAIEAMMAQPSALDDFTLPELK